MAEVAVSWDALKKISAWTPLTALEEPFEHLGGTLFRLSPTQYLICPPYDAEFVRRPDVPGFVAAVLWAAYDGAARRAVLKEVEADNPESRPLAEPAPPGELLLPGAGVTYGSIVAALRARPPGKFLESATYRLAKDGTFVHRNISAAPYSFFWLFAFPSG